MPHTSAGTFLHGCFCGPWGGSIWRELSFGHRLTDFLAINKKCILNRGRKVVEHRGQSKWIEQTWSIFSKCDYGREWCCVSLYRLQVARGNWNEALTFLFTKPCTPVRGHSSHPPRDVILSRHHVGYWKSSVYKWCVSYNTFHPPPPYI